MDLRAEVDGYRALIITDEQRVELRSRKNKDLAGMYRGIAAAGQRLKVDQAVVDGEIVALDAQGSPSFQALQHRGSHAAHQIVFYAFDLLHLDGKDLNGEPLLKRRARLARVLDGSGLFASQELPGTAAAIVYNPTTREAHIRLTIDRILQTPQLARRLVTDAFHEAPS